MDRARCERMVEIAKDLGITRAARDREVHDEVGPQRCETLADRDIGIDVPSGAASSEQNPALPHAGAVTHDRGHKPTRDRPSGDTQNRPVVDT